MYRTILDISFLVLFFIWSWFMFKIFMIYLYRRWGLEVWITLETGQSCGISKHTIKLSRHGIWLHINKVIFVGFDFEYVPINERKKA